MKYEILNDSEMELIKGGEAISIAAVMAVLAAAVVAVVVYRLFMSSSGSTTFPGGFKFIWND